MKKNGVRPPQYLGRLFDAVVDGDATAFFGELKYFLAGIPYELDNKNEKHYQTIFYLVFKCLGFDVKVEQRTSAGRTDAVIEEEERVWIFVFKLHETTAVLTQIKEKGYHLPYLNSGKEMTLFGVGFDRGTRNIGEWVEEEV